MGKSLILMARATGLEPATSGVTGRKLLNRFNVPLQILPLKRNGSSRKV